MSKLSPKIAFYDEEKLKNINKETMKLWDRYKIDMSLRELSPKTIDGYENDMQQFFIYVYDNLDNKSAVDIDEDDVTEFLYYCQSNGNNSRRIKRRMSSISAFYKFLRKRKVVTENPMEFIDRPKKDTDIITQTYLTIDQVNLMREKLKESVVESETVFSKHYALQLQCYALVSLVTMARVNAIRHIRWEQIDYEQRIIFEVLEKEGYIVELYFNNEVKELFQAFKAFREENNISDNGYVFISGRDDEAKNVTSGTMNRWCKVIGEMIDVPTLHPHDFRHSYATILKDSGMELEEVSKLLNHKGTDVTQKYYIKTNTDKLRENKDMFDL